MKNKKSPYLIVAFSFNTCRCRLFACFSRHLLNLLTQLDMLARAMQLGEFEQERSHLAFGFVFELSIQLLVHSVGQELLELVALEISCGC